MTDLQLNTKPIVGQLRNKPEGGSEVFDGNEWRHHSDDTWENASMRIFNYMNPAHPTEQKPLDLHQAALTVRDALEKADCYECNTPYYDGARLSCDKHKKYPSIDEAIAAADMLVEGVEDDYKLKYETLKQFVRGKWKGDCSECASIANEIFIKESETPPTSEGL